MEVKIQAVNFDASEKLVEFINKKAERLARHNVYVSTLDFTLKVTRFEAPENKEVILKVVEPNFSDIIAEKISDTFEESVDNVIAAVERPLERRKDQRK